MNVIEYEEDDELGECMKDYCKLGCICDSLRTKQIAPLHCGKVDCMFSCCCSKEALKWVEGRCGSRRVNISAAVGERIMEDTQRGMAAEERKFSNTVVVTADKNTVMLGGRGLSCLIRPSLRLSSAKWSPVASKCQPIKAQEQKVSNLLAYVK